RADDGTRAHLTTRNVARDLDQLRGHLGEERLNILGYAYGTYVASVYGTMFPDRTDRTVLDSSVHPDWPWQAQFQSQPKAIRRNVLAWAAWVAERPHFGFGCTSQAVVNTLHAATKELDRRPRAGITGSIWDAAVGIGATRRSRWGKLAFALSAILDEEAGEEAGEDDVAYLFGLVRQGLRAGVEPSYTAGEVELRARLTTHPGAPEGYREAVMQAVTCEVPWSHDLSDYEALVREYAEHCPWGLGASRAMPWVATWHAERPVEPPTRVDRAGYPAGLVVAAEGDPLDDVAGAQEMAARLGHRLVVVEDDGGHELYPLAGNPHVNAAVEDYLVNGQLPSSPITRVVGESRPDIPTAAEGLVLHE
ncbi:MAG: alpha/beta hydrolase, partial [Microlunatus sp.]|nr:alpha/beta hydrolase [Microlunatus sp.]